MQPCGGLNLIKGRARHTPHKRYFIMFVRGHTVLFLCLCDLVNKDSPQSLLRLNRVPQSMVRARYTPSQTVSHNVCSGAHCALLVFV